MHEIAFCVVETHTLWLVGAPHARNGPAHLLLQSILLLLDVLPVVVLKLLARRPILLPLHNKSAKLCHGRPQLVDQIYCHKRRRRRRSLLHTNDLEPNSAKTTTKDGGGQS